MPIIRDEQLAVLEQAVEAQGDERSAYAYWLAIKVLWQWLGRMEDPPKPR